MKATAPYPRLRHSLGYGSCPWAGLTFRVCLTAAPNLAAVESPQKASSASAALLGKAYCDRFVFLMASAAMKYDDTATISRPRANATPSTNIIIFPSHSLGYGRRLNVPLMII